MSTHAVRDRNVEENVVISEKNVLINEHHDLIGGQFWIITGVRDRNVEEEVLIDGVRDDDDEDKL